MPPFQAKLPSARNAAARSRSGFSTKRRTRYLPTHDGRRRRRAPEVEPARPPGPPCEALRVCKAADWSRQFRRRCPLSPCGGPRDKMVSWIGRQSRAGGPKDFAPFLRVGSRDKTRMNAGPGTPNLSTSFAKHPRLFQTGNKDPEPLVD